MSEPDLSSMTDDERDRVRKYLGGVMFNGVDVRHGNTRKGHSASGHWDDQWTVMWWGTNPDSRSDAFRQYVDQEGKSLQVAWDAESARNAR